MFKIALKNYLKYWKYFLIVFAFFMLAVFSAGAFFVLGAYIPLENVHPDTSAAIFELIQNTMKGMEVKYFFSSDFFMEIGRGTYQYIVNIESNLKYQFLVFMLLAILAFFIFIELGQAVSRKQIRKAYQNEDTIKGFWAVIIRLGFTILSFIAYTVLVFIWSYAIFIIPIMSAIVSTVKNVCTTYFIYFRKYSFKSFIQKKDILNILVLQIFTLIFQYIIIIIALNIMSVYYLLLVILPTLSYTSVIICTATEEYYKSKLLNNSLQKKTADNASDNS